jgi:hypothetical protein
VSGSEQQAFLEALQQLEKRFAEGGQHRETDEETAEAIVGLILERERLRQGVAGGTTDGHAVDKRTLSKMAEWDSDDPSMLTLEKVFRRLANGRGIDAVVLLKRAITDRQRAVSEEQRRRASAPRRQHPVQVLVEQIVALNPAISAKKLERALRREVGRGVILLIDETEIQPCDESFKAVKLSGLDDRLSDARKKIAKAG